MGEKFADADDYLVTGALMLAFEESGFLFAVSLSEFIGYKLTRFWDILCEVHFFEYGVFKLISREFNDIPLRINLVFFHKILRELILAQDLLFG